VDDYSFMSFEANGGLRGKLSYVFAGLNGDRSADGEAFVVLSNDLSF
jgi:hypothetical protein